MKRFFFLFLAAYAGLAACAGPAAAGEEILPKHLTPQTQKTIKAGLDYLAKTQNQEGNWSGTADGTTYPTAMAALAGMAFLAHGDTPSRGPYAANIHNLEIYLLGCARPSGLITSPAEADSRSMYGHGFSLLFLASVYGMETDPHTRDRLKKVITNAMQLTARGQSEFGGWTYVPGGGDEGSVTVTQMQGLRAASNAGFSVPKGTVEAAVKYLEKCKTADGGIVYSLGSGGEARLAISAAAVATLYNAGQYDSKLAESCLDFVWNQFALFKGNWNTQTGHDCYTHLYASQAFYQAGDKYWDVYFPPIRDYLIKAQLSDGSWSGDEVGPVFGTSISLIILQMPYKYLPIYQR